MGVGFGRGKGQGAFPFVPPWAGLASGQRPREPSLAGPFAASARRSFESRARKFSPFGYFWYVLKCGKKYARSCWTMAGKSQAECGGLGCVNDSTSQAD